MRPAFGNAHVAALGAVACLSLGSTGCAFLFKGSRQSVAFTSDPQGADVNNNGNYLGPTPATADIHRTGISNIKVSKEGYAETYVHLDRTADIPWFFWDFATCVIPVLACIPVLTDALSGAWYNYDDSYAVKLVPLPMQRSAAIVLPPPTRPADPPAPPPADSAQPSTPPAAGSAKPIGF